MLIAGNWKMFKGPSETRAFAEAFESPEGVDVVLNSLSGDAIARGMGLLRPGGRFLEMGKRDILQNSPLGLQLLDNNRSFLAIDLNRLSRDLFERLGEASSDWLQVEEDRTHFTPAGARRIAAVVLADLQERVPELRPFIFQDELWRH